MGRMADECLMSTLYCFVTTVLRGVADGCVALASVMSLMTNAGQFMTPVREIRAYSEGREKARIQFEAKISSSTLFVVLGF